MSTRQPTASSNVRRNLFNHLSRRPTASTSQPAPAMPESTHDDSTDIVVKDQNGRFQVQMPALPVVEDEQAQGDAEAQSDSGNESQAHLLTGS